MDYNDPHEPIKSETTLNRSYLKHYVPSWGHNTIQINKLRDADPNRIWYPLPSTRSEDQTFLKLEHNEA